MKDYFYCYSPNLKRGLIEHGFRYICTGQNQKSGAKFWLFPATEELNEYKDNIYPNERKKIYKENK